MPNDEAFRTWDGLERAADDPLGATIAVRRPAVGGGFQFLTLHRNVRGPEYGGDWAWTSPAGCRKPGEGVYSAAVRELAEEAGITGCLPWAVDLSVSAAGGGGWTIFALDVPADTVIDLVDPEHDRFEWVSAAEAAARIKPAWVAESQISKVALIPTVTISFRDLTLADLSDMVRWHRAPHATQWFHGEALDLAEAERRYAPRVTGETPTRMWVVELDGTAVGYVQAYPVGDYPDYAAKTADPVAVGFDYLIGDAELVGKGLGTRMIWEFLRDVAAPTYPSAPRFLASPSHRNKASLRVLEKCGFTQGLWIDEVSGTDDQPDTEIVCTLDRHHWLR